MSNARNAAVALYTLALANAATADWQAVATSLFDALPKAKAAASDAPVWWSDYAIPKAFTLESIDVTFADGATFRCNLVSGKNKPPRVAGACRGAIGLYRAKHGERVAVPAFSRIVTASGQAYDAATCSRLTDDLRAIPGTVQGRPMTAARVEWMAKELARRESGLAPHLADLAGANASPWVASLPSHARDTVIREIEAGAAGWRASVAAGENELALMREAFAVQRGEAAPVAVAQIAPVVALLAAPVAVQAEPSPMHEWCALAVSEAYGECSEFEIPGTFEIEAGPMSIFSPSSEAAKVNMPAPVQAATISADIIPEIITAAPVSIMDAAPAIMEAPEAEAWMPTVETHPVVAYCLSEKAWHAIRDRVQDGTFPAPAGAAKFGAWRLTLADAQDLQDVGSIRLAGMPRKPYTRRGAVPVAPVSAFVRIYAGAAFMASNPPSPATLHAPSV
jgi:hypothetical protein